MTVIWSALAEEDFSEILTYLESTQSSEKAADLVIRLDSLLDKVVLFPYMYPAFEDKEVREALVRKNLILFYRIDGEFIQLLRFWDTRQNPNGLNF